MTVADLIKELQKLPEQAQLQDVRIESRHWEYGVRSVTFQGNHTKLEAE